MNLNRREFLSLASGATAVVPFAATDPSAAAPARVRREDPATPAINPFLLTGSLGHWPLAALAEIGYRSLEVPPAALDRISEWGPGADAAGLRIAAVNALPDLRPYLTGSLHDGVERRRAATIDRLKATLSQMGEAGIPYLIVAPGRLAENYQTPQQAKRLLIESLEELSSASGATILVDGPPARLFASAAEIATVVDAVARPNVAAVLNIGHASLRGEDPVDAARHLGTRLRYVQAHDVDLHPGHSRLDRHLPLGDGSLQHTHVSSLLTGYPLAVDIAAPHDPVASARRSLEWLGL